MMKNGSFLPFGFAYYCSDQIKTIDTYVWDHIGGCVLFNIQPDGTKKQTGHWFSSFDGQECKYYKTQCEGLSTVLPKLQLHPYTVEARFILHADLHLFR